MDGVAPIGLWFSERRSKLLPIVLNPLKIHQASQRAHQWRSKIIAGAGPTPGINWVAAV